MSAPNIALSNSETMSSLGTHSTDYQSWYYLYADDYYFENWTDWVNDSLNSPTNRESQNAADFTNYVLKFKCKITGDATTTSVNMGRACCIKSSAKGALCIVANEDGAIDAVADTTTAESNTYALIETEWDDFVALSDANRILSPNASATDTVDNEALYLVQNNSENDTFFQFFYCGGSRDFLYTCYKYMPATDTQGNPRFEAGGKGQAFFVQDNGIMGNGSQITLTGAFNGVVVGLASMTTAILALSF